MHNDEPTPPEVPELPHAAQETPGAPPLWPMPSAGDQRLRPQVPVAIGCLGAAALGGCLVLLFSVGVLLGHAGVFLLARSPAHSAPGVSMPSPTLRPTTTPLARWLQVDPTSVQLGCGEGGGQQTQVVVLANRGPQPVQWQVSLSVPTDQAGVAVSPSEGELASGASTTIQLQLQDQSAGQQQGVIRFVPETPEAGASPSLTYTTVGCT
jgi:ASPM-SPD-2-Hydin domain-containing protein